VHAYEVAHGVLAASGSYQNDDLIIIFSEALDDRLADVAGSADNDSDFAHGDSWFRSL
jgi:hypothetical protein